MLVLVALLFEACRFIAGQDTILAAQTDIDLEGGLAVAGFLLVSVGYLTYQVYYVIQWNGSLLVPTLSPMTGAGFHALELTTVVPADRAMRILHRLSFRFESDRNPHPEPDGSATRLYGEFRFGRGFADSKANRLYRPAGIPSELELEAFIDFLIDEIGPGRMIEATERQMLRESVLDDLRPGHTFWATFKVPRTRFEYGATALETNQLANARALHHGRRQRNWDRVRALMHRLDNKIEEPLFNAYGDYYLTYHSLGAVRLGVWAGASTYIFLNIAERGLDLNISSSLALMLQFGVFALLNIVISRNRHRAGVNIEEAIVFGLRPYVRQWIDPVDMPPSMAKHRQSPKATEEKEEPDASAVLLDLRKRSSAPLVRD